MTDDPSRASDTATPLDISPAAVAKARSAGYTDDEIVAHLSQQAPDKFATATKAGYSPTEILQHLAPQSSGLVDSTLQGVASVPAGVAATLKDYTGPGFVGNTLDSVAKAIAPSTYTPAPIVDKDGVHPSNIAAWAAERAPSMAAAIAAARMTPGPWWTKLLGGAAAGVLMGAGNEAQTAASNRTGNENATPNASDLTRGGLTAAAENAAGTIGLSRFLPSAGVVLNTGVKGLARSATSLAKTVAAEGTSGAAQSVAGQVGQSVGTPSGVSVDPAQVADSAAGNAITGGALGALPAARTSLNALKYRAITPDLAPAATQFANRMQQTADGAPLTAGVIPFNGAQRTGAEAFTKARDAVKNELSGAVADLRSRVQLPTDANNVLDAAINGQQPNNRDYATLNRAVQGDPQADNVLNLVRQAHVADIVESTGHLSDDKFTGGISGHVGAALTGHNVGKTALYAGAGAALEGGAGHVIAYSPEALSALAGATVLARMADRLTGARTPAGRFVSNFADGTTPVRQNVAAPQVPPGPSVSPTGPKVPQAPTPWGPPPPVNPADVLTAQQKRQMALDAMPLLRRLAQQAKPVNLPQNFASTLSNPGAPPAPVAPVATQVPGTVPADVLANARAIAAVTAPKASAPEPQITGLTKANGTVGTKTSVDEYVIPRSPYAHLVPSAAAQQFLADAQRGGTTVSYPQGFINSTVRNITDIRNRAAAVAKEVPGVSAGAIAAQFEGVGSQNAAIAHREWLKEHMPQAAAALDQHFSDEAIKGTGNKAGMWKRVGK